MRLANKVAIVTGAGRGIGEAIGLKCAKDGANVSFDIISFNPEKHPSVLKISSIFISIVYEETQYICILNLE